MDSSSSDEEDVEKRLDPEGIEKVASLISDGKDLILLARLGEGLCRGQRCDTIGIESHLSPVSEAG
jgi:hypothetical protein